MRLIDGCKYRQKKLKLFMENERHETFISHDNNKQDCQIAINRIILRLL